MDDLTPPGQDGPPIEGRASARSCYPVLRRLCLVVQEGVSFKPDGREGDPKRA